MTSNSSNFASGSHQINSETWGTKPKYSSTTRPLEITLFDMVYAPACVLCFFISFMLITKKLPRFHGSSLRHHFAHFINAEHVYTTLSGADDETAQKHKQLEFGHLAFELGGVILLIFNMIVNEDQTRFTFLFMQYLQMFLFLLHIVLDFTLLQKGFIHIVRGTNSKLRFAHSSYQSLLFALDAVSSSATTESFMTLPVDCFVIGISHYLYEATGEILEGCNMSGSGDLVIVVAIVANAVSNETPASGIVAAFGLSCLVLSCSCLFFSMVYKIYRSRKTTKRFAAKKEKNETEEGEEQGEKMKTLSKFEDGDEEENKEEKKVIVQVVVDEKENNNNKNKEQDLGGFLRRRKRKESMVHK